MIPGYRGFVSLVRRSGELSTIDADVVYEKDKFVYTRGTEPRLEHVPSDDANPGKLVAAYAIARLKDGGFQIKVMRAREIEAIRKRSKAATDGPWVTDYDWMAKKTTIKQLCKLLPVSTETQRALALDDRAEMELPQDLGMLASETETATPVDEPLDGDVVESKPVQMPERVSAQPQPVTSAPAPPKTPVLPDGADQILGVSKHIGTTTGKPWWKFETKRAVLGYTWSTTMGPQLETAKDSGAFVVLGVEQDSKQQTKLVGLQPFDPLDREPGSDG